MNLGKTGLIWLLFCPDSRELQPLFHWRHHCCPVHCVTYSSGRKNSKITVLILLVIAAIYTVTVWFGMKGVSDFRPAVLICSWHCLLMYCFEGGECTYMFLETGFFSAMGKSRSEFYGYGSMDGPS